MFVPVSCTRCGKPFQVPEATLGKLAPCPWCAEVVTALPVSTAQPEPPPAAPAPEPLSLDDAPAPEPKPPRAQPVAPPAPVRFPVVPIACGCVLAVVVMSATLLVLGFRAGRLPEGAWTEFTPPDGSFTVALPGHPTEEDTEPVADGALAGGKRFAARRWYTRTTAWAAYNDLDPGLAQKLQSDRDRVVAAGVLRVVRDREVARLKGTVTKEAEVRLDKGWGIEIHLDSPDGPALERLVLMSEAKHPRLYVYGIQGKRVTPDGPAGRRLFASFRLNE